MIPETHLDLIKEANYAILTTLMPDGQPQSSMIWLDYDGQDILINTALERQKTRNMQNHPKVSIFIIDPQDDGRWISIQGRVLAISSDGAIAHADKLTQRYTNRQKFYGDVYSAEKKEAETRVIVRIAIQKVALDAVFR